MKDSNDLDLGDWFSLGLGLVFGAVIVLACVFLSTVVIGSIFPAMGSAGTLVVGIPIGIGILCCWAIANR